MDELTQAKHPVTQLAGWYGHPLHPALVSIPIGAWVASVAFDVASHLTSDTAFLVPGATWLLVIGLAGAAAAGMIGFLDLFAIPTGTRAFRTGLLHMTLTLVASTVFGVGALLRRGASVTEPTSFGLLALSVLGLLILLGGGFLGGELAFRYGVRVAEERHQVEGYLPPNSRHAPSQDGPGSVSTSHPHQEGD